MKINPLLSLITTCYYPLHRQKMTSAFSLTTVSARTRGTAYSLTTVSTRSTTYSLAATSSKQQPVGGDATFEWSARQDCWRPDVRDVEKISFGMPAKKKRTGSRGVPHRLNEEERRSFDQARRQGFLQVTGSSWRSQRSDAPLLNSYRSLMDAKGRPMIVMHKLSPNSSGEDHADKLVVDLSPLRLPDEFELVGNELKKRILAEFDVESSQMVNSDEKSIDIDVDDATKRIILEDNNGNTDKDDYETRPIYQIPSHYISWEQVSRQEGKNIGKYLGQLFGNVEENVSKTTKPKGVKPGKSRRHGGYGIG